MGSSLSTNNNSTQLANLRDQRTFTTFESCPDENGIDSTYYVLSPGGYIYKPIRHWCLLAEIAKSAYFPRLYLTVKDRQDKEFLVAFHLETRETPGLSLRVLDPNEPKPGYVALYKTGYTVVILYPNIHYFRDGQQGIRQEDDRSIMVLPYPLKTLLNLNDTLVAQKPHTPENAICHACGAEKSKSSLSRCLGCLMFWYCNKDCQNCGWTDKGHKAHCKMLRNQQIKALFTRNWRHFEDYWTLPF